MEIIKDAYAEELIEVTCPHCGSILRCTKEEKENHPCIVCGGDLSEQEYGDKRELLTCDHCKHVFYGIPEEIGEYGLYYTYCPECSEKVFFDYGIDVTTENLELKHFSSFSDGVKINFKDIKAWIARGVNYLKNNPNEYFYYTAAGNSFVLVQRDDDDFYVMYTDDYKDIHVKE